jgi:hypothetical protein
MNAFCFGPNYHVLQSVYQLIIQPQKTDIPYIKYQTLYKKKIFDEVFKLDEHDIDVTIYEFNVSGFRILCEELWINYS